MKQVYKLGYLVIIAGAITAILIFWEPAESESIAEVHMLNIGQGDAILVELPNKQRWLIDGGPDNSVVAELQEVLPFGSRQLTGIILTHPHSDHVSGLVQVLQQYQVSYALFAPTVHTSPVYKQFLETVQQSDVEVIPMTKPFVWQGENWRWEFFYPLDETTPKNLNDSSIVSKLTIGGYAFLFMGDAEESVEQLLVQQRDLRSNILKVGHHGSDTSTSEDFLKEVQPEYALISVGKNNRFNHPSPDVLDRLDEVNAQIYRTDEDGRVSVLISEQGLTVVN